MLASREWVKSLLGKLHIGKYSTDEVRVGTWVDGKPIYRKVVTVQMLGGNGTTYALSNYGINNVKSIVKCYGMTKSGSSLPTIDDVAWRLSISANPTNIYSSMGTGLTPPVECTIVLEYTKTTD